MARVCKATGQSTSRVRLTRTSEASRNKRKLLPARFTRLTKRSPRIRPPHSLSLTPSDNLRDLFCKLLTKTAMKKETATLTLSESTPLKELTRHHPSTWWSKKMIAKSQQSRISRLLREARFLLSRSSLLMLISWPMLSMNRASRLTLFRKTRTKTIPTFTSRSPPPDSAQTNWIKRSRSITVAHLRAGGTNHQ